MKRILLCVAMLFFGCTATTAEDWEQSFNKVSRVTVLVQNVTSKGVCSGVVVAPDKVLTNAHCAGDKDNLNIIFVHNREAISATLLKRDPDNDIALLRVDKLFGGRVELSKDNPKIGEELMSVSWLQYSPFPTDEPKLSALIGRVIVAKVDIWAQIGTAPDGKAVLTRRRDGFYLQVTGRGGISGGPIVNSRGELVGIGSTYSTAYHDIGAIRVETIRKFLKGEK